MTKLVEALLFQKIFMFLSVRRERKRWCQKHTTEWRNA